MNPSIVFILHNVFNGTKDVLNDSPLNLIFRVPMHILPRHLCFGDFNVSAAVGWHGLSSKSDNLW